MKKSILALILTIAVIMILQTAVAASEEVLVDGIYYTLYEVNDPDLEICEEKYAAITGNDGTISGDVVIQSEVVGYPVTKIGPSAFCYSALTSVTIPEGVTCIEAYAFGDCISLTSVSIPGSIEKIGDSAFYNCGLESITIPAGVKIIDEEAFANCEKLSYVVIPSSVTEIGESAFASGGITEVYFLGAPPVLNYIYYKPFPSNSKLYYNPSEVVKNNWINSVDYEKKQEDEIWKGYKIKEWKIGDVNNNYDLEADDATNLARYLAGYDITINEFTADVDFDGEITPKDSMILARYLSKWEGYDKLPYCRADELLTYTSNGDGTCSVEFNYEKYNTYDSDSLEIDIPKISDKGDVVTSIAEAGFCECGAISSITIPNSVTSIGYSAFYGCTGLSSITIPDSVTSIEVYAFFDCSCLTSITLPDSVTYIGNNAFNGCTVLTSITIPKSVTSIGDAAFKNCTSLSSITIPAGVTSIGDAAFNNCTSLSSITIPAGVTRIREGTFSGCTSLSSITIPNSITSIEYNAFSYCTKLSTIRYNGTEADWEKISKEGAWDYEMPEGYKIVFNYTGD